MSLANHSKTKRTSSHKKLKGEHHRRSKHYLRAYHPFLPLLMLAVIGLAVFAFWKPGTAVLGSTTGLSDSTLLESTNQERERHSLLNLSLHPALKMAAQAKAEDMAAKNYWSHDTPDGMKPWAFVDASGYKYLTAGENLAYGFSNATATVYGWMNSDEHRANLLNPQYQHVGFGIATAREFQGHGSTTIIVAMYGQPDNEEGGNGLLAASTGSSTGFGSATEAPISYVQLMTGGQAPWSFTAVTLLAFAAVALFTYRHARIWHNILVKGEAFVVHHKMLDFIIIASLAASHALTRAAGYIH